MKIVISTIPHKDQAYETCGDYRFNGDVLNITVSDTGDSRYNALIALHELTEAILVLDKGVKIEDIDAFDKKFEEERSKGIHAKDEEPGDAKEAPYRRQHKIATHIEREIAKHLDVDWEQYNKVVMNLE